MMWLSFTCRTQSTSLAKVVGKVVKDVMKLTGRRRQKPNVRMEDLDQLLDIQF